MASRAAERCVGLYTSSLLTCRRCGGRGEEGQVRGKGQAQGGGRRDAAGVDPPGLQRPSVPAAHQKITDQAPVTTTTTTTTQHPSPPLSSQQQPTHQVDRVCGHALGEDLGPRVRLDLRELEFCVVGVHGVDLLTRGRAQHLQVGGGGGRRGEARMVGRGERGAVGGGGGCRDGRLRMRGPAPAQPPTTPSATPRLRTPEHPSTESTFPPTASPQPCHAP